MIDEKVYLELAKKAARKVGDLLRRNFQIVVDDERDKDIKLNADKQAEALIVTALRETGFPILSEEMGELDGADKEYHWIIDPLDGTANYWRGIREFCCTSIALWKGQEPILGVVYRFFTDEMYSGIVGTGAWKNEMPITTTGETNIGKAFLATGFPVKRDYSKTSLDGFVRDVQRFKKVRMLGAAAVMGSLVAEGKLDVYMEDEIMLWDIAASSAIVKAAGGCIRIEYLPEYKCICKLFANDELLENYYADSL